jgi:urate oxidase
MAGAGDHGNGAEAGAPGIVLGPNRYGKAEVRLLHVARGGEQHEITDLNVSIALAGDLSGTHLTGDNANVIPTDTQKNAVYAFARRFGVTPIEEFGRRLGEHFAGFPPIARAQVHIQHCGWRRISVGGTPHPHSFERAEGARIASVHVRGGGACEVVAGVDGLVLLKSTGSEFRGFRQDEYTTLQPAGDRILATAIRARWRLSARDVDWDASFSGARAALVEAFAATYSRSLQQTLYAMGQAVLLARPEVCEVRLSLPNKHHFLADLGPFGLDNPGEVFYTADRPYGLIEGTVQRARTSAADPDHDW